jgi:hypothetical protein
MTVTARSSTRRPWLWQRPGTRYIGGLGVKNRVAKLVTSLCLRFRRDACRIVGRGRKKVLTNLSPPHDDLFTEHARQTMNNEAMSNFGHDGLLHSFDKCVW